MALFSRNKQDRYSGQRDRDRGYADTRTQDMTEDPRRPSPKAIIYKSELDFISRCIQDFPNIETGGELFGFWTQLGTPVVLYAVGPGPYARHHPTSFVQDPDYVDNIEVEMCLRTGLQHVGQWHSHHQLGLAHPSGGDVASMQRGVGAPGFPRMLLCIGNCDRGAAHTTVNAFNFHENYPSQYVHAFWDVVEIESPFRAQIDRMYGDRLYSPRARAASHGEMKFLPKEQPAAAPNHRQHWLTECVENVEMMKQFLNICRDSMTGCEPAAEITDAGEPLISLYDGNIKIMLPYGFPEKAPKYVNLKGAECYDNHKANIEGNRIWKTSPGPLDVKFEIWLKFSAPFTTERPVPEPQSEPRTYTVIPGPYITPQEPSAENTSVETIPFGTPAPDGELPGRNPWESDMTQDNIQQQ